MMRALVMPALGARGTRNRMPGAQRGRDCTPRAVGGRRTLEHHPRPAGRSDRRVLRGQRRRGRARDARVPSIELAGTRPRQRRARRARTTAGSRQLGPAAVVSRLRLRGLDGLAELWACLVAALPPVLGAGERLACGLAARRAGRRIGGHRSLLHGSPDDTARRRSATATRGWAERDDQTPAPTTSWAGTVSIDSMLLVKSMGSSSMSARGLKSGRASTPCTRRRCMPKLPAS
jgi:hypothetical protein